MNDASISETPNTRARELLFERFAKLAITASVVPYPSHSTAEEGKALRGYLPGTFTKNLLLKDKKGRLFLIAFHEDRALDLKSLHTKIGANGRLGFAPAERMEALLGVLPGALTPLGIINDTDGLVTVVVDAVLLDSAQINFHPLAQEESVGLAPTELLAFIRSCDREPLVVQLGSMIV